MTAVVYSAEALEDLVRLEEFLQQSGPASALATAKLIIDALEILEAHPYIGRPFAGELRQLVISRGHTGYVAVYRYREDVDTALVLAIRHQREAGFED